MRLILAALALGGGLASAHLEAKTSAPTPFGAPMSARECPQQCFYDYRLQTASLLNVFNTKAIVFGFGRMIPLRFGPNRIYNIVQRDVRRYLYILAGMLLLSFVVSLISHRLRLVRRKQFLVYTKKDGTTFNARRRRAASLSRRARGRPRSC